MYLMNVKRKVEFFNLDAIIAVGYRVNSSRATQFRIWATQVLKEFIIKGYTMDVERLKNPKPVFGQDYFKEQLEKIRDIRSSERRLYQQITDIYAYCSIDYSYDSEITKKFFATIQNNCFRLLSKHSPRYIKSSHKTKTFKGEYKEFVFDTLVESSNQISINP